MAIEHEIDEREQSRLNSGDPVRRDVHLGDVLKELQNEAETDVVKTAVNVGASGTAMSALVGTELRLKKVKAGANITITEQPGGEVEVAAAGGGGGSAAADVSYDRSGSGLVAVNVQNAIDELKELSNSQTVLKPTSDVTGANVGVFNTPLRILMPHLWGNIELPYFARYLNGSQTPNGNLLVGTGTSGTAYTREIAEINKNTGAKVQSQVSNVGSKTRSIVQYANGVIFYPSGNDIRLIDSNIWLGANDTVVATVASAADSLVIHGNTLVAGCEDGVVRLFTITTGPVALTPAGESPAVGAQIRGMAMGDNNKLYVYANDAIVRVVDLSNVTAAPVNMAGVGSLAGTFVAEGIAYLATGGKRFLICNASITPGALVGIRVFELTDDVTAGASDFYRSETVGGAQYDGLYARGGNVAVPGIGVGRDPQYEGTVYGSWFLFLSFQVSGMAGIDPSYPNLLKYRVFVA